MDLPTTMPMYLAILIAICVFILTVIAMRRFVFPRGREKPTKDRNFQEGLANGGVGSLGRVAGRVEVEVRGGSSGAAAVCISRDLNVMYWWRATGINGHNLIGDMGNIGERTARAVIATTRLWGQAWQHAEEVFLYSNCVSCPKLRLLAKQQLEDCQNKYGVRIRWTEEGAQGADGGLPTVRADGGRELVNQLMEGRGAGQSSDGFYNINLRVMDESVFQLVDHTSKLTQHYFSI